MTTPAREDLLARAEALFASRGYDAVGVQEIVLGAGVTKPTLYHHFGSKRGLLDALLTSRAGGLAGRLAEAAVYRGDLPATLRRIAGAHFEFVREAPAFYRLLISCWFAPPSSEAHQAVLPYLEAQHALLEALFAEAARDHGNMRGRQRIYAASFLGALNTFAALSLGGHAELNAGLVHQAVHQFEHGIYS